MNRKLFLFITVFVALAMLASSVAAAPAAQAGPAPAASAPCIDVPEVEPNDTPAQAQTVPYHACGARAIGPGDVDYVKFTAAAGDQIILSETGNCDLDSSTILTLFDANLTQLAQTYSPKPLIVTLKAGVHYVRVEPYDFSGAYSLALDTLAGADALDNVPGGARPIAYGAPFTDYVGEQDVDWYKFQGRAADVAHFAADMLSDSHWDGAAATLYDANLKELAANVTGVDLSDTLPAFLLPADGWYYLKVTSANSYYEGMCSGSGDYRLTLARSHSLYVSSTVDGLGGNAAIKKGDIAVRHPATGQWVLVFDASDVGITQNINAFEFSFNGRILFSLSGQQNVPGIGLVKPADILRFTPVSLGENTAGTLNLYLRGADVGLTTAGEKIDAISWAAAYPADGRNILISLTGSGSVPAAGGALAVADEDVIAFVQSGTGQPVQGAWELYQDGAVITGLKAEDIGSATMAPQAGRMGYDYQYDLLWTALPGTWAIGPAGVRLTGGPRDVLQLQYVPTQSDLWRWTRGYVARTVIPKPIDGLSLGPVWGN